MNQKKEQGSDIIRKSFERETARREEGKNEKGTEDEKRSLMGRPKDPNSLTTGVNFPPGLDPKDAGDPGRSTPGAPPVDNRSGKRSGKKK